MRHFLREGYVTLQSELPRSFHERAFAALDTLDEGGPRGHNNLLPCVPELARLLEEPTVRGALASILGPGYHLHFHRHDHFQFPGAAQALHKDGDNHSHRAVDGLRRMHRTRFAMLFYYPQDTPLEKGPTGIVPRSHYVPRRALEAARGELTKHHRRIRREIEAELGANAISPDGKRMWEQRERQLRRQYPELFAKLETLDEPWEAAKMPLVGTAGTVTIVHFDMVHGRYSANTTSEPRHMVKFLFTRRREPTGASWQHEGRPWPAEQDALGPVWRSMWNWHRGAGLGNADGRTPPAGNLTSDDDREALAAAYSLGLAGEIPPLLDAFRSRDKGLRTMAAYGLVAAETAAVPALLRYLAQASADDAARVIDVLGDVGPPASAALPALREALAHPDVNVRRYAVEAIGTVAQRHRTRARDLIAPLEDDDALVRSNAALAIARLAEDLDDADALLPALRENLAHWHHHARGWAIEALLRLTSPRAREAAIAHLHTARWDPMPKSGDVPPGAAVPKRTITAATPNGMSGTETARMSGRTQG